MVLILSGLQIHYPGFAVFGTMQTARFLHLVSGYFFLFLGVLHVYFFFAPGKRKIAMPHLEDRTPVGVAGASETAAVAAGTPAGDPAGQPA